MRPTLLLCSVPLLLASVSPALAQSDAAKAQALKRYQEGITLHDKGHDEEAYLQFTQAYAVVQTPPILFNLARTEQLTGRHIAAAEHFREYVALPEHPRVTKDLRAKAQGFLAELASELGHLTLDVPAGSVVSLDGKDVPTLPTLDVEPGPHTVAARLGDRKGTVDVVAVAGAATPAKVVFPSTTVSTPVAATVPPTPSSPVVPVAPPPAPSESHTTRDVLRWSTAGVAVAGLAVGTAFLVEARSQASDFNSFQAANPTACANPASALCSQAHSKDSSVSQSATLSGVGFAVGGVAAVTSAALWIFWPHDDAAKPAAASWFQPSVGVGSYAVEVGGRF